MKIFTDISAGARMPQQSEVIEIKLWEVYLLINRSDVQQKLAEYSIDNGPLDKSTHEAGRLTYRFMASKWEPVKHMLYENRIPVVVQSNHLSAVKVKGRQPELV